GIGKDVYPTEPGTAKARVAGTLEELGLLPPGHLRFDAAKIGQVLGDADMKLLRGETFVITGKSSDVQPPETLTVQLTHLDRGRGQPREDGEEQDDQVSPHVLHQYVRGMLESASRYGEFVVEVLLPAVADSLVNSLVDLIWARSGNTDGRDQRSL